jgi:hypothetical protein
MYGPNTFITTENRNGRPHRADHYICQHGNIMSECTLPPGGRGCGNATVELAMVTWWNNSFVQMQDRITVRDRMLQGV